jgi:hypothetical protein
VAADFAWHMAPGEAMAAALKAAQAEAITMRMADS